MPSPNKSQVHKKTRNNKPRKCGGCGQNGHDRRNCPVNPRSARPQQAQEEVVVRTAVEGGPPNPLFMPTVAQEVSTINWEKVLYVIFDLETTGRSRQLNEIIEIAAQVLDPFGIQIEDADFSQLVRPKKGIPPFITQLTTIDNDMVSGAEEFASVGDAFIRFMQQAADEYSSANDHNEINHVILVAHNGKVFDIPFFIQQLSAHQMTDFFLADKRFGMAIDTLKVARHGIRTNPSHGIPSAFNLPTLYQFVSGMTPELSHRALADVKATATIFRFEIFWKVRIVTKAAQCGIKIYVITDAVTAFVLRVLIYTGRSTYGAVEDQEERLKTVQVVNHLVQPFVGTYRTIYVDRFYTSLELLKSLEETKLYITGTMLANRIPQAIPIAKTSPAFRQMSRGDAIKCKVRYRSKEGKTEEAGLVCWRDRNMVYCLSNDSNNHEFDECSQWGNSGIIRIPRPLSISNYNKYMGGVDLADMRRLHCNSTIMGQNRWWLKLFFYLLDVGTSNALVLYNKSARI